MIDSRGALFRALFPFALLGVFFSFSFCSSLFCFVSVFGLCSSCSSGEVCKAVPLLLESGHPLSRSFFLSLYWGCFCWSFLRMLFLLPKLWTSCASCFSASWGRILGWYAPVFFPPSPPHLNILGSEEQILLLRVSEKLPINYAQ